MTRKNEKIAIIGPRNGFLCGMSVTFVSGDIVVGDIPFVGFGFVPGLIGRDDVLLPSPTDISAHARNSSWGPQPINI